MSYRPIAVYGILASLAILVFFIFETKNDSAGMHLRVTHLPGDELDVQLVTDGEILSDPALVLETLDGLFDIDGRLPKGFIIQYIRMDGELDGASVGDEDFDILISDARTLIARKVGREEVDSTETLARQDL